MSSTIKWYTRRVGNITKIGFSDDYGACPDGSLDFYIYGYSHPSELTMETEELPLDDEFTLAFCKIVANDILQTSGTSNPLFVAEYDAMEIALRTRNVNQNKHTSRVKRNPLL